MIWQLMMLCIFYRATKTLAEMRSTFGANCCRLLCINSSKDGSEEHENLWAAYVSESSKLICFMSYLLALLSLFIG